MDRAAPNGYTGFVATLAETLAARTREAVLVDALPDNWVRCVACGHACRIPPGAAGVCKVRFNRDGHLLAPWGYAAAVQCDPVEKKPFFHVLPGSLAFSFGMLGCDLHCGYCQNWVTSQALRDTRSVAPPRDVDPAVLAERAIRAGARLIVSTYNEPLITSEWAVDVFREARHLGLATAFVSNGNGTSRVLDFLAPWLDFYKVDLKGFNDRHYRQLGGRLHPILETIAALHKAGIWVEIVTLLVPGFNDDEGELRELTAFVAGVSRDMPWHVTAFRPDYKMQDGRATTAAMLVRAAVIGQEAGLRYVYAGNMPGHVGDLENTRCPACSTLLVERRGYAIVGNHLIDRGACPVCHAVIAGRWTKTACVGTGRVV